MHCSYNNGKADCEQKDKFDISLAWNKAWEMCAYDWHCKFIALDEVSTIEVTSIQNENAVQCSLWISLKFSCRLLWIDIHICTNFRSPWGLWHSFGCMNLEVDSLILKLYIDSTYIRLDLCLLFSFLFNFISFYFIFSEVEIMHLFDMTFIYFRIFVTVTCQCDESAESALQFFLCVF